MLAGSNDAAGSASTAYSGAVGPVLVRCGQSGTYQIIIARARWTPQLTLSGWSEYDLTIEAGQCVEGSIRTPADTLIYGPCTRATS